MPQNFSSVHDQVVSVVEPLTRFDSSSVLLQSEAHEPLACAIVWTSRVELTTRLLNGSGSLGSGVKICSGQDAMQHAAEAETASELALLDGRLQSWSKQRGSLPLDREPTLTVADCFSGSRSFGYTYRCGSCSGGGRITCGTCNGSRTLSCYGCGGSGSTTRTEYRNAPSHVPGQYVSTQYQVRSNCASCGGTGRRRCATCSGSGLVQCFTCVGTGIRNQVVVTDCQVQEQYATSLTDPRDEVRSAIEHLTFQQMLELATVHRESSQVLAMRVTRRFNAILALTSTRLLCGTRELGFFGYGPRGRIFNFKNVVGVLLAGDLDTLHEALRGRGSWLPFRSQSSLQIALSNMLDSEVHQDICDSPEKRTQLMRNGTVSAEHSERTLRALRRGFGRLFRSGCALNACALSILFLAYELVGFRFLPFGEAVLLMLTLALGVGAFGDWLARRRTLRYFRAEQRESAATLLHSTGALLRGRLTVAAASVLAGALIPVAAWIDMTPHKREAPKFTALDYKNYQPADIQRLAAQAGLSKEVMLDGEVYIRGDISGVKLHSTRGYVVVQGKIAHSSITIDAGYLQTNMPITDSTLKAKIIAVGPVTHSDITCQECNGKFGAAVQIHRVIWPKTDESR